MRAIELALTPEAEVEYHALYEAVREWQRLVRLRYFPGKIDVPGQWERLNQICNPMPGAPWRWSMGI